jgi:GT2 family glycosyltransferase
MEPVDIFVINYNGEKVLSETLRSLKEQDYPETKITVIDDGSSDKSLAIVKKNFPDVSLIPLGINTRCLNKLRRMAIGKAVSRFVFVLDNDVVLAKDCLSEMVRCMTKDASIGICTPRLMYYDKRDKINISWTKLHYLCASISPNRDAEALKESTVTDTVGGGIMLLDSEKLKITGTSDDSYDMGWGDDAELYIRMNVAGFRTVHVPQALGYHHAKEWGEKRHFRAFGQVYNRMVIMLTMYQMKTLVLCVPPLLVYEFFLFSMLLLKKIPLLYFSANFKVIRNLKSILRKRRSIQATRRSRDRDFLTSGPLYVPPAHMTNRLFKAGVNFLSALFNGYWKLIRVFL